MQNAGTNTIHSNRKGRVKLHPGFLNADLNHTIIDLSFLQIAYMLVRRKK